MHYTDGVAGTRKRLAVAERHAKRFSIATECGFGRRDPATIPELLRIMLRLLADAGLCATSPFVTIWGLRKTILGGLT